jgi:hypothetical protein
MRFLEIQIQDATAQHRFDRNGIVLACVRGEHKTWRPIPDFSSELSSVDAVWYRSEDLQLRLSPDEVYRLVRASLRPEEYYRLRERYGIFFEIQGDFYDPRTGTALQPRGMERCPRSSSAK